MQEKKLTEQESLQLITEMIGKAKGGFHETGTSAILWGSVITFCGLASFVQREWKVDFGFDVWILTLIALVPQIFIISKERRERKVLSHTEAAMNGVWLVYGISLFALIFYANVVPGITDSLLASDNIRLVKNNGAGEEVVKMFIPSYGSLLLILYAMPTLASGLAFRFRPMIVGALLCYAFFVISCFSSSSYDMLLNGLAGLFNWLLPGLILRRQYLSAKVKAHV